MKRNILIVLLLAMTAFSWSASASSRRDRALDARPFYITPYGYAFVDTPKRLETWRLFLFIEGHYIASPLSLPFAGATSADDRRAIEAIYGWDLGISAAFPGNVELMVTFPVERADTGPAYDRDVQWGFVANDAYNNLTYYYPNGGPGDPAAALKWGFYSGSIVSASLKAHVRLPFGTEELFLGDDFIRAGASMQLGARFAGFGLYFDGGYVWRKDYTLHDPTDPDTVLIEAGPEVQLKGALAWHAAPRLTLFGAAGAVISLRDGGDAPRQFAAGAVYSIGSGYYVSVWGGSDGAGSDRLGRGDAWHVFARFSWETRTKEKKRAVKDTDGDGIPDDLDECINEPEDHDGFEDDDGCPEADNDGDGLPDDKDKCPLEPEDEDGYQDSDGCPDPDNDGDGILDIMDRCPGKDGHLDTKEDMDKFEDDDGCPDPDNDHDGILDAKDQCPNRPETFNGIDDTDGCPDVTVGIKIADGKIIPVDRIEFKPGTAELTERSKRALLKIANYLKSNASITLLRIEAHVAPMGSRQREFVLSSLRAEAVRRFLVERGVPAYRLEAVGYGARFPVASNKTRKGRRLNERVEFIIVFQ